MAELTFEEQLEAARIEDEKFVQTPPPVDEEPTVDETSAVEITAEMWDRAQQTLKDTAKKLLLAEVARRTAEANAEAAYAEGFNDGEASVDCGDE